MKKPIPDLSRTEIEHLIHEWVFNQREENPVICTKNLGGFLPPLFQLTIDYEILPSYH